MQIGIPKESETAERRVALTPAGCGKLVARGFSVLVERGAGLAARSPDDAYLAAGATLGDRVAVYSSSDLVVQIGTLSERDADLLRPGGRVACLWFGGSEGRVLDVLRAKGATLLALERIPRTTVAQSFDVLSSMANVAGYRAVIEASNELGSFMSLQMTAAGKVPPKKVLVIGAGVAGLAAIGAARALGADVRAFDTRPAVKEEVKSLGARFLELQFAESGDGGGGYARVMSQEFIDAEMALFRAQAPELDVVITTALIPGRPAPRLWLADMVRSMKPGSVIVDMAAEQGGNCELTQPGRRAEVGGVVILGYTDLPSRMAGDASTFFANNMVQLLRHVAVAGEPGVLAFDPLDRNIGPALVLLDGATPPPLPPEPSVVAPTSATMATSTGALPAPHPWVSGPKALASLGGALLLLALGLHAPTELLQHLTVFVLACFVGWQVVWNVTPALHTPLMSVTNAISGIILVGGMLQAGAGPDNTAGVLGLIAVLLASVNVFGGFLVTQRMLKMFRRKA